MRIQKILVNIIIALALVAMTIANIWIYLQIGFWQYVGWCAVGSFTYELLRRIEKRKNEEFISGWAITIQDKDIVRVLRKL